jgi:4-carboxymuconolactone decarboxylase
MTVPAAAGSLCAEEPKSHTRPTITSACNQLQDSSDRRRLMADQPDETPILDLLASMTASSLEASSLDAETLMLVRIAALVAVDAPPVSYLLNLRAAGESGVNEDQVQGVLAAVAPIVGTARVASAAGKMVRAFDLKLELGELEGE